MRVPLGNGFASVWERELSALANDSCIIHAVPMVIAAVICFEFGVNVILDKHHTQMRVDPCFRVTLLLFSLFEFLSPVVLLTRTVRRTEALWDLYTEYWQQDPRTHQTTQTKSCYPSIARKAYILFSLPKVNDDDEFILRYAGQIYSFFFTWETFQGIKTLNHDTQPHSLRERRTTRCEDFKSREVRKGKKKKAANRATAR